MFGNNIKLGKLFGVVIYLHPLWFLILALWCLPHLLDGDVVGAVTSLILIVGVYTSVLAHEYAHVFTARAYGISTPSILIHLFGGFAMIGRMPWGLPEAVIAAAGPIFSALLGVLLLSITSNEVLLTIGYVNMILALFNLLPLPPLDGGRIARGLLYAATGKLVLSTRIVTYFGLFVAVPILFTFFIDLTLWSAVLIVIIGMMSMKELKYIEVAYGGNHGSRSSSNPINRNRGRSSY